MKRTQTWSAWWHWWHGYDDINGKNRPELMTRDQSKVEENKLATQESVRPWSHLLGSQQWWLAITPLTRTWLSGGGLWLMPARISGSRWWWDGGSAFKLSPHVGYVHHLTDPIHNVTIMDAAAQNEACGGMATTPVVKNGHKRWDAAASTLIISSSMPLMIVNHRRRTWAMAEGRARVWRWRIDKKEVQWRLMLTYIYTRYDNTHTYRLGQMGGVRD